MKSTTQNAAETLSAIDTSDLGVVAAIAGEREFDSGTWIAISLNSEKATKQGAKDIRKAGHRIARAMKAAGFERATMGKRASYTGNEFSTVNLGIRNTLHVK